MHLGVLDNDPHPLSKTPGKPPEKNGIGEMLDGTKALQMRLSHKTGFWMASAISVRPVSAVAGTSFGTNP
jgi:hypothetical protein